MIVFVDTSAFYAGLDQDDINHKRAKNAWTDLLAGDVSPAALRLFYQDVVPLLAVDWISQQRHQAGVEALLAAARRKLSLVDCISFQTMRDLQIDAVFCFDPHFREQGFKTVP